MEKPVPYDVEQYAQTSSPSAERGRIVPFERKVASHTAQPKLEYRIIGKKNGRDVSALVQVQEDGSSIFDHQPEQIEKYSHMMERIDPGIKKFDNYDYDSQILDKKVFYVYDDAIGQSTMYADVYLLGDHYKNGLGMRIPKEEAWNRDHQDETHAMVKVYANPYKKDTYTAHVLKQGSQEYRNALMLKRHLDNVEKGRWIEKSVEGYREKQSQIPSSRTA